MRVYFLKYHIDSRKEFSEDFDKILNNFNNVPEIIIKTETDGIKIPREKNEELFEGLKRLYQRGKIFVEFDNNKMNVYLNNFSGILQYTENGLQEVLLLHKKICSFYNLCNNKQVDCKQCNIEEDEDRCNTIYNNYKKLFSEMLNKIYEEVKELPFFQLYSPVFAEVEESFHYTENEFLKLLLLTVNSHYLYGALNQIFYYPHRKIERQEHYKSFSEVSYIDENILFDIIYNPQYLFEDGNGVLSSGGKKYMPIKILQYDFEESFDTLENRFIKNFLDHVLNFISNEKNNQLTSEINQLCENLHFYRRNYLFSEVGELNIFPSNSQVLVKQSGYREIFYLDRILRSAVIPSLISGSPLRIPVQDMATLFEYYVFIKILKYFKEQGYEIKPENTMVDNRGANKLDYVYASIVIEDKELKIYYQKEFKLDNITLRPDFVIENNDFRIALDAKFTFHSYIPTDSNHGIAKYLHNPLANLVIGVCLPQKDSHKYEFQMICYDQIFNKFECEIVEFKKEEGLKYFLVNCVFSGEIISKEKREKRYIGFLEIPLW